MDFRDIKEFFNDAFKYIILIVVVFVVAVYILSFQQVVGNSMEPTFSSGDVVLINKLFPTFFDIDRNDVIVLVEDSSYLIKRVIGLPGEYIKYEDNKLYIDGELIEEEFLESEDFDLNDLGYDVIPEGYYFVLGDNRLNSKDSVDIGLISEENIIGKAILRIWPLNKITLTFQ